MPTLPFGRVESRLVFFPVDDVQQMACTHSAPTCGVRRHCATVNRAVAHRLARAGNDGGAAAVALYVAGRVRVYQGLRRRICPGRRRRGAERHDISRAVPWSDCLR